jgi:hypothetical protein
MPLSQEEERLRDVYFKVLLLAVLPLQPGEDPEVTLEALIEAAQKLKERLQQELAEVRREQAE